MTSSAQTSCTSPSSPRTIAHPLTTATDTLFNSAPDFIQEHVLQPDSAPATLKRQLLATAYKAFNTMSPIVLPLLNRLTQALYGSPDIVVIGFLLVALVLVFQILSWLRRALVFWTRIAFRMSLYAGLAALAASVWQRGLAASWEDAVAVGGALFKYGGWVKDFWMNEYRKYEQQGQARGGHSGAQAGAGWNR